MSWEERAKCARKLKPEPHLPGVPPHERQVIAAKYCAGCPVKPQCAQQALDMRSHSIIRAGVFIATGGSNMKREYRELMAQIAGDA